MKPKINLSKCLGCEECVYSCPVDAIRISKKTGKPFIIEKKCINCGSCIDACPINAIKRLGNDQKNSKRLPR